MAHRTPLYDQHLAAGAKMVDFADWEMPIHYGSLMDEHHAVRTHAGLFDVSHMTVLDLAGAQAVDYLRRLLANEPGRLTAGAAQYSAMLTEDGGVVDDLIAYRLQNGYRLVTNCATREKDLQWMTRHALDYRVELRERTELAMLAVHGPASIGLACEALKARGMSEDDIARVRALNHFQCLEAGDWFVARTGYTGELGLEIVLPAKSAGALWAALLARDIRPIGLGARDTLRLEAGMNLYGHEMDEQISPLSANMARTIAWDPPDRRFIGREALERQREDWERGRLPRLVGLLLEGRGVLRQGQVVHCEAEDGAAGEGIVTSGTFSPTLKRSVALARVPPGAAACQVNLRGKWTPARIVQPGFVRRGKACFE